MLLLLLLVVVVEPRVAIPSKAFVSIQEAMLPGGAVKKKPKCLEKFEILSQPLWIHLRRHPPCAGVLLVNFLVVVLVAACYVLGIFE